MEAYPKQCPRCKTYFPGVWKECNRCKVPLVSARVAHVMKWVKIILVLIVLLMLVAGSTYYMQPAQRKQYEKGYTYLKKGRYDDAQKEWRQAFAHSPYAAGARSLGGKIAKFFPKSK